MLRTRLRVAVMAITLVSVLSVASVALASNSTPPVLKSPGRGAHLTPGKITLRVYSPGLSGPSAPVYVAINPHRKVNKHGHLIGTCSVAKGCEFYALTKWKGHPGWWTITANDNFPGFWAVTRGTYYWQANHVAPVGDCRASNECELASAIHVFHIK